MTPSNSRIRVRLSRPQVLGLCAVALVSAAAATLGSWTVVRNVMTFDEVEILRAQNQDLRASNDGLESRVFELQAELIEYEKRTEKLALVAGLQLQSEEFMSGLGGEAPTIVPVGERLDLLSFRSLRLTSLLDDVETRLAGTPSLFPAEGLLTSRFGYRSDPLTGERSFHRGIDIGSYPDRAVLASADGVVSLAGRKGALGNAVHLSHGFGLATRYGHMSRLAVERGQEVKRGEIVGYVGRTGRTTGYHLHFEVLMNGSPVDPMQYVDKDLTGP